MRHPPSGQTAGDVATTIQGVGEIILGSGGEAGGLTLDATGVGAVIGVPANIVSAGIIAHGGLVTVNSGKNLIQDAINAPAESRSKSQSNSLGEKEHTKDARPSTEQKHEEGVARRQLDQGGEKGDETRRQKGMFPRKRPRGWKGPWPPKKKKQ